MASSRKRKMTTQRATTKPLLRLLLRPLGKRSLSLSLFFSSSLSLPAVLPPRSFHSVLLLFSSRERQAKCSSRFVNPTFRNVFDASDWLLKNAKAYAQKAGPLNRRASPPPPPLGNAIMTNLSGSVKKCQGRPALDSHKVPLFAALLQQQLSSTNFRCTRARARASIIARRDGARCAKNGATCRSVGPR